MTEYIEEVDVLGCEYVINNLQFDDDMYSIKDDDGKKIAKSDVKKIVKYLKEMLKNKGRKQTKYNYSINRKNGRLFAVNGIQNIPKDIRGLICRNITTDIDMTNCHIVILNKICKENDILCPQLEYYVKHREEVLHEISEYDHLSREDAKIKLLKATNSCFSIQTKSPFLKTYDKEVKKIQNTLLTIEKYNYVKQYANNDKNNYNGSFINHILCIYENEILQSVIKFIKEHNIEIHSLMFDGLMVYGNFYDNTELLRELEEYIMRNCEIDMKFVYKQHSTLFNIPDDYKPNNYENLKTLFEESNCKVGSQFVYFTDKDIEIKSKKDFKILHEHKYRIIDDGKDKEFTDLWFCDPRMKFYDYFDVYPNIEGCPSNVFNLWKPFPVIKHEYTNDCEESEDRCKEGLEWFLNHIKVVLCNNNEEYYNFVCMWIAQMFQYPQIKTIMLVFISEEGAGKGVFLEFLRTILGWKKVFETTDPQKDVFGQFNNLMKDAYLVCFNEANKSNFYNANDKKKALITDPTININIKGVSEFTLKSFHRFILFTNNPDPLPNVSKQSRREFICRCSDEKIPDEEYFKKGFSYSDDINIAKTIYDYFMKYPTKSKIIKNDIPITSYHSELMENNKSIEEQFLIHLINENNNEDTGDVAIILTENIFEDFKNFCVKCRLANTYNKQQFLTRFGMFVKKIDGIDKKVVKANKKAQNAWLFDIEKLKVLYDMVTLEQQNCYIDLDTFSDNDV